MNILEQIRAERDRHIFDAMAQGMEDFRNALAGGDLADWAERLLEERAINAERLENDALAHLGAN